MKLLREKRNKKKRRIYEGNSYKKLSKEKIKKYIKQCNSKFRFFVAYSRKKDKQKNLCI